MSNQTKNTNLNILIDLKIIKANKFLALSFENENDRILF